MATIEHQLTEIYVFVDDYLKAHPRLAHWRSSPNARPAFSDAEVLTIGLMQGCLGVATLRRTFDLIAENSATAFPALCSYKRWVARLHALMPMVGHLLRASYRPTSLQLFLFDTKPVPVCKPSRHGRSVLLREEGAWFGKSSTGWFFGFKLHALCDTRGCVCAAALLPGNENDRDAALALGLCTGGGIALADLGYRSAGLAEALLEEADLLLITRADTEHKRLVSRVRQRVETAFSRLWADFIDRVYSRSFNGLWNTIELKLICHNLKLLGLVTP